MQNIFLQICHEMCNKHFGNYITNKNNYAQNNSDGKGDNPKTGIWTLDPWAEVQLQIWGTIDWLC